jgi:hypothetical protein
MKSKRENSEGGRMDEAGNEIRSVVQAVIQEFVKAEQSRAEPAYKTELLDERKRRETLEQRVNELVAENQRARAVADEAERNSAIRTELQRLGVAKLDLAYKAVRDDVYRNEDGRLLGQGGVELGEYLTRFVSENPELLPARLSGGSGASTGQRAAQGTPGIDMDKIKPGMSAEDMERVRQEIAKVASQTLRGI